MRLISVLIFGLCHYVPGTDYWGLSLREAIEWINENGKTDATVLLPALADRAAIFSNPSLNVVSKSQFQDMGLNQPDYYLYLAIHRWQYQEKFPECPIVHSVTRQGVPLAMVKQCNAQNDIP